MKIAILQLARVGDIYQTAPAINAYKRSNPTHKIDLIVRNKFSDACHGLKNIDNVIELPTKHILKPLIQNEADIPTSLDNLESWLMDLSNQGYHKIINLSFSPLSSWITFFLQSAAQGNLEIVGYSRTLDGFLAIPDDMSAYVYAQCGPGYPNRFHIAEIFGTLLGVDLTPQDWVTQDLKPYPLPFSGPFIAIQTSASQEHKSIPPIKMVHALNTLKNQISIPIVLLGSETDQKDADTITNSCSYSSLYSYVGKTTLLETMAIIKQASLFVGPDSSLQNIASLTGTKTLLVSIGKVNFFETGPRAAGSFVLTGEEAFQIEPGIIGKCILSLLYAMPISADGFELTNAIPCFRRSSGEDNSFKWDLLNYIYRGFEVPKHFTPQFALALQKLFDVNSFSCEILDQISSGTAQLDEKIIFLEQAEDIINAIQKLNSDITPIIAWYKTEKLRIGPGTNKEVLSRTQDVHNLLNVLCTSLLELLETQSHNPTQAKDGAL